jgi:hypothetical protein
MATYLLAWNGGQSRLFHRAFHIAARLILDIWETDAIVAGLDGIRLLDRGKCSLTNWVR